MFTGIIECFGKVQSVTLQGTNRQYWIQSPLSAELQVDQSVSHDGVCLTVEAIENGQHRVTAIAETIAKTNLSTWEPGHIVNMERCMQMNGRLDGHIVQGHADCTAQCLSVTEKGGSWEYCFEFHTEFAALIIEKGSVAVNGTSLTCFAVTRNSFKVAIIPYTFEHTNIHQIQVGSPVNIEFDILGKYIQRKLSLDAPE
jgi:riboflavin synthase